MKIPAPVRFTPLLLFLLLVQSPRARAQSAVEPLVTDRPDFTESAAVVAPGWVQVESGYTFSREGALESHTAGEVLVRVGLLRAVELRLGFNSYVWVDAPSVEDGGFSDTELGLKLGPWEPGVPSGGPGIALLLAASVPTGAEGFGEDEVQPGAKLAAGWDLSDRVAVGSNLNVALASDGGDRFTELGGSLALGLGLAERLGGYVEYFGFVRDGRANEGFLNGGFTYLLSPDLQVDARAGLGLDGPEPDYFVGAGFAWRWRG